MSEEATRRADSLRYDVVWQREYVHSPFRKWLLAIPHAIVLVLSEIALLPVRAVSALIVLVSGRYPRPLFRLMVGHGRWLMRVSAYLFLLTDAYPPFSSRPRPAYPVRFELDYPPDGRISRWRPLVAWVLVMPQLLALVVVYVSVYLMVLVALFSILFTRIFPPSVFDFIVRALRFRARVSAYALFMTERYPGFSL